MIIDKATINHLKKLDILLSNNPLTLKNGYLLGFVDKRYDHRRRYKNSQKSHYFLHILCKSHKDSRKNKKAKIPLTTDISLQQGDLVVAKYTRDSQLVIVDVLKKDTNDIGILKQYRNERRISHLKTGEILKVKASQKSLKALPLDCLFEVNLATNEIISVLGSLKCAKNDIDIVLRSHNKYIDFSDEVLDYVKSFDFEIYPDDFCDRVDLTHLPFVTIDPCGAQDFDDAIYFDGTHIFVAIADVSYYVAESSIIDMEAINRGFSIYFPNFCVPMLPSMLSQNRCSLRQSSNRLAFTWKLKINKKTFEVSNAELFLSVIRVAKNLNYDIVDRILQNPNKADSTHKMLHSLYAITSKIRKKRLKSGFDFVNKEILLELDSNDEIVSFSAKDELESHKLVEECMLLANKQSAILMSDTLNGGIYRIHDEMSDENIRNLCGEFGITPPKQRNKSDMIITLQSTLHKQMRGFREIVDKAIISYMPKAQYSANNIGHFALGFDSYTHFTSPIRRYSDIIAHRILKEILQSNTKKARFLLLAVDLVASKMNFLEKEIATIEFEYEDRKYARYFANRIGMRVKCIVIDEREPCVAKILDSNARIFVDKNTPTLDRFAIIEAQITHSNIENAKISAKFIRLLKD